MPDGQEQEAVAVRAVQPPKKQKGRDRYGRREEKGK